MKRGGSDRHRPTLGWIRRPRCNTGKPRVGGVRSAPQASVRQKLPYSSTPSLGKHTKAERSVHRLVALLHGESNIPSSWQKKTEQHRGFQTSLARTTLQQLPKEDATCPVPVSSCKHLPRTPSQPIGPALLNLRSPGLLVLEARAVLTERETSAGALFPMLQGLTNAAASALPADEAAAWHPEARAKMRARRAAELHCDCLLDILSVLGAELLIIVGLGPRTGA